MGNLIGKLMNVALNYGKNSSRVVAKTLKPMETAAVKAQPRVHENYGEILQMAKKTPKDSFKFTSKPTQQVIDNELTYAGKLDRLKQSDGVYLDRKAVADANWAFTHPATPVKTESIPTKEVIEKINNTKLVDELRNAEAMGELTPAMRQKRSDMLAALDSYKVEPEVGANKALCKKITTIGELIPNYIKKFPSIDFSDATKFKSIKS